MPEMESNPDAPTSYNEYREELEWYINAVHSPETDERPITDIAATLGGVFDLDEMASTVETTVEDTDWGLKQNPTVEHTYTRVSNLLNSLSDVSRDTHSYKKNADEEDSDKLAVAVYSITNRSCAIVYVEQYTVNGDTHLQTGVEFPNKTDEKIEDIVGEYEEVDGFETWRTQPVETAS